MMATTIMISTSVKPDLCDVFIFILFFLSSARREHITAGGLLLLQLVSTKLPAVNRVTALAEGVPSSLRYDYYPILFAVSSVNTSLIYRNAERYGL